MPKAILFDLDGTVVNSEPLHLKTFRECLKPLGIRIQTSRWYREFTGIGSRAIMAILFRDFGIKKEVTPWVEGRKRLFQKYVLAGKLKTIKGVRAFLREVKRRKIKTAIVSGGHNTNINAVLKKLKLDAYFDVVIGSEDVIDRKPHPEGFLKATQLLKVKPKECVAVEDSPAGVMAAKNAGVKIVCIKSRAPADPGLCDYVISDFTSFPKEILK